MDTQAEQLLVELRDLHERIRGVVQVGDLEELQRLVAARGSKLATLDELLTEAPAGEGQLREKLRVFRREDGELLDWMQQQKAAVATALASLRDESDDPYQERYVGSALVDRRS